LACGLVSDLNNIKTSIDIFFDTRREKKKTQRQ